MAYGSVNVPGRMPNKQDKLIGQPGQVVGFGADGEARAVLGWSDRNLLDNWYFADPINQRGQKEYTEPGYAIDRWYKHKNTTLSAEEGFVRWTVNVPDYQTCIQAIDRKSLIGEVATASYLVRTNNKNAFRFGIDGISFAVASEENKWTLVTITDTFKETYFSISGGNPFIAIQVASNSQLDVHPGDYIDIKAAKLELGEHQTLAHQNADGNWVLNDPPPNKALELAKCQRYQTVYGYQGGEFTNATDIAVGYAIGVDTARFMIDLPIPMRANPAISTNGLRLRKSNMTHIPVKDISFLWPLTQNKFEIQATVDSGEFTIGDILFLEAWGDSRLVLDANL